MSIVFVNFGFSRWLANRLSVSYFQSIQKPIVIITRISSNSPKSLILRGPSTSLAHSWPNDVSYIKVSVADQIGLCLLRYMEKTLMICHVLIMSCCCCLNNSRWAS